MFILFRSNKILYIITLLFLYLVFSSAQVLASNEKTLIINSGSSEPMIMGNNSGFYPQIIKEVFGRLNINSQITHLPSGASLKNANLGIDDGVIGRVKGIDKKFTNLIRVPVKIMDLTFVAFSNDKNIKIDKWADLKFYNVGYIRGWKIFDKNVTSYNSLAKTKSTSQLFRLLKNKRVDVILHQGIPSKYIMKKLSYFPHEHEPYLDAREMFIYMHKRHLSLVPQIGKVLEEMKKDGMYQQLYDKYITKVITPATHKSSYK